MPTHMLQVISQELPDDPTLLVPIRKEFLIGSWSQLADIPGRGDLWLGSDSRGGFVRGEIPFIRIHLDNTSTFRELLAYTYLRDDEALLCGLLGGFGAPLVSYIGQPIDLEQRLCEWNISVDMANQLAEPLLVYYTWFISDLAKNGNCVGMEGRAFWWILETCLRVVNDALIAQKNFNSHHQDDSDADQTPVVIDPDTVIESSVYGERVGDGSHRPQSPPNTVEKVVDWLSKHPDGSTDKRAEELLPLLPCADSGSDLVIESPVLEERVGEDDDRCTPVDQPQSPTERESGWDSEKCPPDSGSECGPYTSSDESAISDKSSRNVGTGPKNEKWYVVQASLALTNYVFLDSSVLSQGHAALVVDDATESLAHLARRMTIAACLSSLSHYLD